MPDAACAIEPLQSERVVDAPAQIWRARFDAPQWAPTPGQYLVVYDGEVCLGGAVIESVGEENPTAVAPRVTSVAV
jgi:tRNA-specific 2-thiouridylase